MPNRYRLRLAALLAGVLVSGLVAPPATYARQSAYGQVLHQYEQSGNIPACMFSSAQLSSALKGVDTYGAQYFADFTGAIQAALAARASGQCAPSSGARSASIPPIHRNLHSPEITSATAPTHSGLPLPIVLMAILAGAFMLVVAGVGVARLRGWDPAWAAAWRHSWGEAGYRAGGVWEEFRDWRRSA
jgi:hypothetical protein